MRHREIPGAHPGHSAHHSDYLADQIGTYTLTPSSQVEAGSYLSLILEFVAGKFGMDDTGSLRICSRIISDLGRPQFTDAAAANYVTATASNGAILSLKFDPKLAMRPWSKTITVTIERGFLSPGDRITVKLGDRSGGSPGLRMQTYCQDNFRFLVLADVFATSNWALLSEQPSLRIVPGEPASWTAVLPTQRRPGQPFALGLRADDVWGNPTDRIGGRFHLRASHPVRGLPETFVWPETTRSHRVDNLRSDAADDLTISWISEDGTELCKSNPLRIAPSGLQPFWADLHGQSEETIGTTSIREYARYARDLAFIDVICHQGNDFQITNSFWTTLNNVTAEFDEPGRFVFFPGYEWSGNTALGGDRNVIYLDEDCQIRRSSHALVEDLSDMATDVMDVSALHAALRADGRPALCVPHVGGRYANLFVGHDRALERAVEVHSDWGTFDWLLEDAFQVGARVGIVANSDGHKGRQGASHPGASHFGSYGGLTCILAEELNRRAVFDALRQRRHYATTAASRVLMDVRVDLSLPAERHIDDPRLGGQPVERVISAGMGDIITDVRDARIKFSFELSASSAVERVDIRNRTKLVEVWRPYSANELGRRIRVLWEGSEYRGRGRETTWSGNVTLSGNSWSQVTPINRWNVDMPFACDKNSVMFRSVTTGGFSGFEAILEDDQAGCLLIDTGLVNTKVDIADIGLADKVFEAGGLGRRIRVFRLLNNNPNRSVTYSRFVDLHTGDDNAIYLRATFEDGSLAWSSPIYLVRN